MGAGAEVESADASAVLSLNAELEVIHNWPGIRAQAASAA
jgi:hypothetical protein